MRDFAFGNGSGKTPVNVIQQAPDWVVLQPQQSEPWPADLPFGLMDVLRQWIATKGNIHIRFTQGIIKDGNLVGLHVWFDPYI